MTLKHEKDSLAGHGNVKKGKHEKNKSHVYDAVTVKPNMTSGKRESIESHNSAIISTGDFYVIPKIEFEKTLSLINKELYEHLVAKGSIVGLAPDLKNQRGTEDYKDHIEVKNSPSEQRRTTLTHLEKTQNSTFKPYLQQSLLQTQSSPTKYKEDRGTTSKTKQVRPSRPSTPCRSASRNQGSTAKPKKELLQTKQFGGKDKENRATTSKQKEARHSRPSTPYMPTSRNQGSERRSTGNTSHGQRTGGGGPSLSARNESYAASRGRSQPYYSNEGAPDYRASNRPTYGGGPGNRNSERHSNNRGTTSKKSLQIYLDDRNRPPSFHSRPYKQSYFPEIQKQNRMHMNTKSVANNNLPRATKSKFSGKKSNFKGIDPQRKSKYA